MTTEERNRAVSTSRHVVGSNCLFCGQDIEGDFDQNGGAHVSTTWGRVHRWCWHERTYEERVELLTTIATATIAKEALAP